MKCEIVKKKKLIIFNSKIYPLYNMYMYVYRFLEEMQKAHLYSPALK